MGVLQNKIDFEGIIVVENANCNGDPLNGNMPRVTYEGYGEMSDVCIKRKIRNRLLDAGENIFVQSDDKNTDGCKSLKARAEANEEMCIRDRLLGDYRNNKNPSGTEWMKNIHARAKKMFFLNTEQAAKWNQGDSIASVYAAFAPMYEIQTPADLIRFISQIR